MHISELSEANILIIGFAREGMATFAFLKAHLPQAKISITDTRNLEELSTEAQDLLQKYPSPLFLGEHYLENLSSYEVIIKIPSLSYLDERIQAAQKSGVHITSSTNIFYANTTAKIIAITGSKGKSTTSTLIYQCLKNSGKNVELIGNIGEPAISYLGTEKNDQLYVFEMSSYQLEDFHYAPHMGVFVSFFPDHIDHHGTLEAYFEAKSHIARFMKTGDTFIYNASSEHIRKFAESLSCRKLPFLDGTHSHVKEGALYYKNTCIVPAGTVHLLGNHNLENMLAVITTVKEFGVSDATIRDTLSHFTGLPHRLEFVGTFHGITFFDDAISTTPESTIAAIESMNKPIGSLILGGLDRGYDFTSLAQKVLEKRIAHIILLPDSGEKIWNTIKAHASTYLPSHSFVHNMETCVADAYTHTPKETICLLSCASPSYSIFKNFEDKGTQFQQEVKTQGERA